MSIEARGRIGGLIANSWRGISYVKAWSSPAQPRTKIQLQIRAWTAYLIRLWQTIGDTAHDAWNDYAVAHPAIDWTGNPKRLAGVNWYLRCNLRLLQNGLDIIAAPPAVPAPAAVTDFACSDGVLSSAVTWTPTEGTNLLVEIWVHGPHSKGLNGSITRAKRISGVPGESGATALNDLIVARYTVFCRVIDEDTGLASPWVSDTCDPTAE